MLDFIHTSSYSPAVTGLLVLFGLARLGHEVLDLLRDIRKFREGR